MSTIDSAKEPRASAAARARDGDVSALLHLGSAPARAIVVLFVTSCAVFTVATSHVLRDPWQSYVAMVIVSTAGVLLSRPLPDPFPLRDTAFVFGAVVLSTALVTTNLPDSGVIGRETWHLGANTWLMFFLTLRRRAAWAWASMAAMCAITIAWTLTSGRGLLAAFMILDTHVGVLVCATLFALILRRTARRTAALERRSIAAAAEEARTAAAAQIRRTRVAELAKLAVPLLTRIEQGGPFSGAERLEFRLAEARLRDGVRGRSLMLPAVIEAAAGARRRGVGVTLLDDRDALPADGEAVERMVGAIVGALASAAGGSVTIRLVPAGRSAALTVVATDGDDVRRTTLGPDGHEIA
ncbi:hypothetical protein [Demequina sp.]|uniref:hypothetical protein n=1 Tax=Demequina sp. TaxID=2050685 RepID=UPI003A8A65F5